MTAFLFGGGPPSAPRLGRKSAPPPVLWHNGAGQAVSGSILDPSLPETLAGARSNLRSGRSLRKIR